MLATYARSQYQETQVQTTPERLVIMLYDGAIFAIERAAIAVKQRNLAAQITNVSKAQEILCHLADTLDMSAGTIAYDLKQIYASSVKRLLTAHAYDDAAAMEELAEMLSELREGWVEAERIVMAERSGAASLALSGLGA